MATEYKLSYTAQEIDKKLKDGASIKMITTEEYEKLDKIDENTLYMFTDVDEVEVVPPDFAQNDPSAPDYIKNRTHWAEAPVTTTTVILPESTIELEEGYWEGATSLTLTENAECTVTWDGVEYISVSKKIEADGVTGIVLGNTVWMDGEDNGQPFMIAYLVDYSIINVQSMDGATASHTVGITQTVTTQEIHKLDNKYIDAEWMAKPPVGYERVEFLPETVLSESELANEDEAKLIFGIQPVDGYLANGYSMAYITIDGVEYESSVVGEVYSDPENGDGSIVCGNLSPFIFDSWGDGEPYTLQIAPDYIIFAVPSGREHTLKIEFANPIYEQLPAHYIEDALAEYGSGLPEVSAEDEGAFLRVVNGEWKAVILLSVEEGEF